MYLCVHEPIMCKQTSEGGIECPLSIAPLRQGLSMNMELLS